MKATFNDRNWGQELSVQNCISELVGEVLVRVDGLSKYSPEVVFFTKSGKVIKLHHERDCCECVLLEDYENDIDEFDGAKVLSFEEISRRRESVCDEDGYDYGSTTWTFYKLETNKGGLFLRWNGSSNGYYSESVDVLGGTWSN